MYAKFSPGRGIFPFIFVISLLSNSAWSAVSRSDVGENAEFTITQVIVTTKIRVGHITPPGHEAAELSQTANTKLDSEPYREAFIYCGIEDGRAVFTKQVRSGENREALTFRTLISKDGTTSLALPRQEIKFIFSVTKDENIIFSSHDEFK